MYFLSIDFGGGGRIFDKIKNSQYILETIVWVQELKGSRKRWKGGLGNLLILHHWKKWYQEMSVKQISLHKNYILWKK